MCIIVDTCTLSAVFKGSDQAFVAVRRWIVEGKGKMVVGGTTYAEELARLGSLVPIIAELSRQGKIVRLDTVVVDADEKRVRLIEPAADFDDPHLVAIVEVSGCRIVCTLDRRADRFLRDLKFYTRRIRPSIYRAVTHRALLRDSNIVGACKS